MRKKFKLDLTKADMQNLGAAIDAYLEGLSERGAGTTPSEEATFNKVRDLFKEEQE